MPWVSRTLYYVLYLLSFLQNNPTLFNIVAIAGEEKCNEVVGRKIYQVGFTTVVLDFSKNFKIYGFIGFFLGHIQRCCEVRTIILR